MLLHNFLQHIHGCASRAFSWDKDVHFFLGQERQLASVWLCQACQTVFVTSSAIDKCVHLSPETESKHPPYNNKRLAVQAWGPGFCHQSQHTKKQDNRIVQKPVGQSLWNSNTAAEIRPFLWKWEERTKSAVCSGSPTSASFDHACMCMHTQILKACWCSSYIFSWVFLFLFFFLLSYGSLIHVLKCNLFLDVSDSPHLFLMTHLLYLCFFLHE